MSAHVLEILSPGGDFALEAESFEIGLVGGGHSPEWGVILTSARLKRLLEIRGQEIGIRVFAKAMVNGQEVILAKRFDGLWLWELRPWSTYEVLATFRDRRSRWDGLRVTAEFHAPRATNEQVVPAAAMGAMRDLDRVAQYRFLPRTGRLPQSDPPRFAAAYDENDIEGWTAFQSLRWLLEVWLAEQRFDVSAVFERFTLDDGVQDNGHPTPWTRWRGHLFGDCVEEIGDLAGVGVYQGADGRTLHYYPLHALPELEGVGGYEDAQALAIGDYSSARAAKHVSWVPKLYELRLDYVEHTSGVPSSDPIELRIQNVTQLPDDVGAYKANVWVTIEEALDLFAGDASHPMTPQLTLTELRKIVFRPQTIVDYAYNEAYYGGVDPTVISRISRLVRDYRHAYRIPRTWMECIDKWEPLRVAVLNPFTLERAPAGVWADVTLVPRLTSAHARGDMAWVVRPWEPDNEVRALADGAQSGYLELTVVSQPLGIFRVDAISDRHFLVEEVILGSLEGVPISDALVAVADPLERYASYMSLSGEFALSTLITVSLATPIDERRYAAYEHRAAGFCPSGTLALGPTRTVVLGGEPLRVAWDDPTSRPVILPTGLALEGGMPVNETVVRAAACAEAQRYYLATRDRSIGQARSPYWVDAACRPCGTISSVTIKFEGETVETVFHAPTPWEPIDAYTFLPRVARNVLFPQLDFEVAK